MDLFLLLCGGKQTNDQYFFCSQIQALSTAFSMTIQKVSYPKHQISV